MALVMGDPHGRFAKIEKFLNYKPEEEHIVTGDYCDSFTEPDGVIFESLKLLIESQAVLLWGNHDVHYLTSPPFCGTGFRRSMSTGLNQIFEHFIERFVPVVIAGKYVITHAGISNGLGNSIIRSTNPKVIVDVINWEWTRFVQKRDYNSKIFNIPRSRGGNHKFGGIFWADYRDERYYGIAQVFGHSKTDTSLIVHIKSNQIALGCDSEAWECFNTETGEVENFETQAQNVDSQCTS